jgi:hypothetical protein
MTHSIQLTTGLFVIAVPDEMPQPPNSPLDDFQPCPMLRLGGVNATQRLLDMLNPHRDVPPIQNASDRFVDRSADQTRERRFAVAEGGDGSARPPALLPQNFAQCRQRRGRPLRRQRKASRRSAHDLNLAYSDVDVPRLIAMSGANVSSIDRHHDLGRAILSLEFWRRRGLDVGGDTVRSVAHRCVIQRRTRQKHFQQPCRLAIGMPGAQLRLKPPEFRVHLSGSNSVSGDQETSTKPGPLHGQTLMRGASTVTVPKSVWILRVR